MIHRDLYGTAALAALVSLVFVAATAALTWIAWIAASEALAGGPGRPALAVVVAAASVSSSLFMRCSAGALLEAVRLLRAALRARREELVRDVMGS